MFARIGMLLIVVSRLVQLNYSRNGRKEMQAAFLVLQAVGIFLIAISSFADGMGLLGFLNLVSCAGAVMVYLKLKKK